jgi:hypothetical protein
MFWKNTENFVSSIWGLGEAQYRSGVKFLIVSTGYAGIGHGGFINCEQIMNKLFISNKR